MSAARSRPASLADVMAQALAMEREAVQRYNALADVMEVHHNREVEALFRSMARIEAKHAAQIMAEMGWSDSSGAPASTGSPFAADAPESVPEDAIH